MHIGMRISCNNKTKNTFKNILRGHVFGRSARGAHFCTWKTKISALAINNEQSLTRLQITHFHHFCNFEIHQVGCHYLPAWGATILVGPSCFLHSIEYFPRIGGCHFSSNNHSIYYFPQNRGLSFFI